jgi:hypothetical protein
LALSSAAPTNVRLFARSLAVGGDPGEPFSSADSRSVNEYGFSADRAFSFGREPSASKEETGDELEEATSADRIGGAPAGFAPHHGQGLTGPSAALATV